MRYPSLTLDSIDRLRKVAEERARMPTDAELAEELRVPKRTVRYYIAKFMSQMAVPRETKHWYR